MFSASAQIACAARDVDLHQRALAVINPLRRHRHVRSLRVGGLDARRGERRAGAVKALPRLLQPLDRGLGNLFQVLGVLTLEIGTLSHVRAHVFQEGDAILRVAVDLLQVDLLQKPWGEPADPATKPETRAKKKRIRVKNAPATRLRNALLKCYTARARVRARANAC